MARMLALEKRMGHPRTFASIAVAERLDAAGKARFPSQAFLHMTMDAV
jgi:hypothetical protein